MIFFYSQAVYLEKINSIVVVNINGKECSAVTGNDT